MRKILLPIILSAFFLSCKKADNTVNNDFNGTSNTITQISSVTYSDGALHANDFVVLSDGSIIVLADTTTPVGEHHVTLVKIDKNGNVVWTKTYDAQNTDHYTYTANYALSIEKDNNENLYISSEPQNVNGTTNAWILKTDKDGTKLWDKLVANISHEGEYGSGNCVVANNGTVIFLFNPFEGSQSACTLFIISADGSQTKTVSIGNIVYAGEIKITSDNNLIVAGVNADKTNVTKLVLTKLSLDGTLIWQKNTNTQPGTQHTFSLVESNGAFYVAGHFIADTAFKRNFLFAKFSTDGNLITMKNFGRNNTTTNNGDNEGFVINNLSNNNLVIGGYSQSVKSPYLTGEMYLNLLDPQGNILVQDNLGGIGRIVAIRSTGNNGFVALGDSQPEYGSASFRIIKYAY